MEFIFTVPSILKIIIALTIILMIYKLTKSLNIGLIIGTLVLALWSGQSWTNIALISWQRFSSANNLLMLLVIFQVIWLSGQMKACGIMNDLVTLTKSRVSSRTAMGILPALIGLLPMPGGALFSAPMVAECDHNSCLENDLKTRINYWFRHVWEYWWPLYPGVLLAVQITGLQIWQFILLQLPLSLMSIFSGYLFLLNKIKKTEKSILAENRKHNYFILMLPVIIVVFIYAVISILFPVLSRISVNLPMCIAIICAQIVLQIQRPLKLVEWKKLIFSTRDVKLTLMIAIIMIYSAFIEAKLPDGSVLMDNVRSELISWHIPVLIIILFIPFISGLSTGVAAGFVGASFPIVINLLGYNPQLKDLLSYTVLAFSFGYLGMLLSPVHVCLIVTNDYFKTNLVKNIIALIKPASLITVGGIITSLAVRLI